MRWWFGIVTIGLLAGLAEADQPWGFSSPRAVRPANVLTIDVQVSGADAAELVRSLQGATASLPLLQRRLEELFADGRIAHIAREWQRTPTGWLLLCDVESAAGRPAQAFGDTGEPVFVDPPRRRTAVVIRGQSDEETPVTHVPGAPGHSPPPKVKPLELPPRVVPPEAEQAPGAAAFSLEEPLAAVNIEGNVTIPTSEISRHVKVRPGRIVTQAMIKDDVDALVRTRWFASVEPVVRRNADGLVLTFKVLERPIVRRVEYKGCKKIKQPKLEALTNLKAGSPYDVSANRECARRIEEMYHEKGFAFATVELEKGNDRNDREVVFLINEGPKVVVTDVDFQGNKFFTDALLALKLQTKTRKFWVIGGKYDPATIPDDKAHVTQYYHSLGFFDVRIEDELKFSEDRSKVQIVYNITEGERYKIRKITMMGSEIIPEADLRKDHTIQEGEFYTARKINADVEKMRQKYGQLGRMFAKVDAVPRFTEEPGVVDILYKIDEDKVYRIREINVHIVGDHPHTRTNLARNMMLVAPGELADPQKIQKSKRRLEGSGVFESGPELGPRLEVKRVEGPGWVQQPQNEINVARGQEEPPRLSRDALRPAQWTSPKTAQKPRGDVPADSSPAPSAERPYFVPVPHVEEEASIIRGQGDVLLAQSKGPMQNPQNFLFDSSPLGDPLRRSINDPDPNIWNQLPPPEFIDIDTYLTEARTGRLMFGVGVNSNSGVVGNIVLSENNFDILRPPTSWEDVWNGTAWRGAGQKFRIEALPGTQVSRYLVDWQDPYFLDTNVNLGLSGFYFTRFYRDWDEQRLGGRVRLGQQFTQTWSGSVALRLEGVHISDIPAMPPEILAEAAGDSFLSTVRFSLMHDTRDAAFIPSEGHFVEFAVEQAFAEFDYTRFEIDARQFFTTYARPDGYGKHIFTVSGQFGWTGDSTPIYERFYAGGFQSFRGFAFRGVTPLEDGVEIGGQFQLLGTLEYMLPVTANEMLKIVAFSDFGTVDTDVTLDNFRVSVGAGVRVQVPGMGPVPIALDWAVPVVKQDFDRDQLFSFYIGINR